MRPYHPLVPLLIIPLLAACGGGGGSSDSRTSVPIDQQAKINESNVEGFLAGLRSPFAGHLSRYVSDHFIDASLIFQTGSIDQTIPNPCGGSVRVTGSLDASLSTGSLTLTFNEYQSCYWATLLTYTGMLEVSINATEVYAPAGNITIPSDYLLSTSDMLINYNAGILNLNGAVEYQHHTSDPDFDTITLIKNLTLSDSTGKGIFTDFRQQTHYTNKGSLDPSGQVSYSISGRLYDSDTGYIDISTVNSDAVCILRNPNICPLDPDLLGRIELHGDNSSGLLYYRMNYDVVEMDADGDSIYEQTLLLTP